MLFVLPVGSHIRVSLINRIIAKIIDILIVVAVAAILPYPLGPILGFMYSILGDGLEFKRGDFSISGQSLGKKLLRLRVYSRTYQRPANFRDSALRNAPVGVATFFGIIPVWGWLILALVGIPLMVMEIYLMATADSGHRLGDTIGDTEVRELKESES